MILRKRSVQFRSSFMELDSGRPVLIETGQPESSFMKLDRNWTDIFSKSRVFFFGIFVGHSGVGFSCMEFLFAQRRTPTSSVPVSVLRFCHRQPRRDAGLVGKYGTLRFFFRYSVEEHRG